MNFFSCKKNNFKGFGALLSMSQDAVSAASIHQNLLKPSEMNFYVPKVHFQGFRAQLVTSQEYYRQKAYGIELPGFSLKASNGGTAWLNQTIRNELFQLRKVHFNHSELSLSCVIGRNLYCYAPSAGCYSPHWSTASCRLETTRNELFQREKVNF